jgi:glucokinase
MSGADRDRTLALVADIGGTNARFALTDPAAGETALRECRALRNADFASLQHAAEHYLDGVGVRPGRAAIAVACPVNTDEIRLTNRAWSFNRRELQVRSPGPCRRCARKTASTCSVPPRPCCRVR